MSKSLISFQLPFFHLTSSPPCSDTKAPISLVTPAFMKPPSTSQTSDLLPPTEHLAISLCSFSSASISSLASYLPLPLSLPFSLYFEYTTQ